VEPDDALEPEVDAELDDDFESLPQATSSATAATHHSLFTINSIMVSATSST
jgi:hypothetical protein